MVDNLKWITDLVFLVQHTIQMLSVAGATGKFVIDETYNGSGQVMRIITILKGY